MTRTSSPLLCGLAMVLVSIAQTGCQRDDSSGQSDPTPQTQPGTDSQVDDDKPEVAKVTLQVVDSAGYEAALAKLKGKVVLVDFWANWCGPCKAGFPHTVELGNEFAAKGLAVMSVNLDSEPSDNKQQTLAFLTKQKANFINLIDSRDPEDAFEYYDIIGIPHYKLFDRAGKLIRTFNNDDPDKPLDLKDIDTAIQAALEQPPAKD